MSHTKLKKTKPLPPRQPDWIRAVLRQPKGIDALHESSHGVVHSLLDTPGFQSIDIRTRTRASHPEAGIAAGFYSRGYTKVVWPRDNITRGCAWARALGLVAPGLTAQIVGYRDDGHQGGDLQELGHLAHDLEIEPNELLNRAWRLTGELVNSAAVLASIFQTGRALLERVELSALEVHRIILDMQAEPPGWNSDYSSAAPRRTAVATERVT
jgi:hypothetical protein